MEGVGGYGDESNRFLKNKKNEIKQNAKCEKIKLTLVFGKFILHPLVQLSAELGNNALKQ